MNHRFGRLGLRIYRLPLMTVVHEHLHPIGQCGLHRNLGNE